jgi:NAD(P)-dependent dehydrogenase (short-subunit alcohol dehydrogenase family)
LTIDSQRSRSGTISITGPLHREGTPEEVADVILKLVRNEFITGETVTMDGGMATRIV